MTAFDATDPVHEGTVIRLPFVAARRPGAGDGPTLTPYVRDYVKGKVARGETNFETGRRLEYRLRRFALSFGRRPLDQLTRPAIERWLEGLKVAPGTRRLHLSDVKTFCAWLVASKVIGADPTVGLRVKKVRTVPRALRGEDITAVLEVVEGDLRGEAIVWLMLAMGLRCVEVSRLSVGDLDQQNATLLIRGKGGHERILPVPAAAMAAVVAYMRAEGATWGRLIRSRQPDWRGLLPAARTGGTPADSRDGITAGYISTMVARWMRDAGVKGHAFDGVSAHALRHTAASDVLERSGDLRAVQEMLGHQDLNTTAVYLRRAGLDRLRGAMEGRDYGTSR